MSCPSRLSKLKVRSHLPLCAAVCQLITSALSTGCNVTKRLVKCVVSSFCWILSSFRRFSSIKSVQNGLRVVRASRSLGFPSCLAGFQVSFGKNRNYLGVGEIKWLASGIPQWDQHAATSEKYRRRSNCGNINSTAWIVSSSVLKQITKIRLNIMEKSQMMKNFQNVQLWDHLR